MRGTLVELRMWSANTNNKLIFDELSVRLSLKDYLFNHDSPKENLVILSINLFESGFILFGSIRRNIRFARKKH